MPAIPNDTEISRRLSLGPWCWARPREPDYKSQQELYGAACPRPRCGETVIVTANDAVASAWALVPGLREASAPPAMVSFDFDADRCWGNAIAATLRWLPILPGPTDRVLNLRPQAVRLATVSLADAVIPARERVLSGGSFGLAFVLAVASLLLGTPVPDNVCASATVCPKKGLGVVKRLDDKLRALAEVRRVEKLLIWEEQDGDIEESASRLGIKVIRVNGVETAIKSVFKPRRIASAWKSSPPEERQRMVNRLFAVALGGTRQTLSWDSVAKAAGYIPLDDLPPESQFRARITEAIANRRMNNTGTLPDLNEAELRAMPPGLRIRILAHYGQHAALAGEPAIDTIEKFVLSFVPPLEQCSTEQIRAWGALGRALATNARFEHALAIQRSAVQRYLDDLMPGEASYSLVEWLRLAGLLENESELNQAIDIYERLRAEEVFDPINALWLDLARVKGEILIGRRNENIHDEILARIDKAQRADDRLRYSSLRWQAQRHRMASDARRAEDVIRRLQTASTQYPKKARIFLALAELDQALAERDAAKAAKKADAVRRKMAGLTSRLVDGILRQAWPERISRAYPS